MLSTGDMGAKISSVTPRLVEYVPPVLSPSVPWSSLKTAAADGSVEKSPSGVR